MASKRGQSDDGGGEIGAWIVTFSDCMTLLLCFFVLLLTFSSFDPESLARFEGTFNTEVFSSMSIIRQANQEAIVPPRERNEDHTIKGSESSTDVENKKTENPKQREPIIDTDAYSDRKVFHIPSDSLFWAKGYSIKPSGRQLLGMIANFVKQIPCRTVITEVWPQDPGEKGSQVEMSLNRSWAIMSFFTEQKDLPRSYFSIATPRQTPEEQPCYKPMIQIALSSRTEYR